MPPRIVRPGPVGLRRPSIRKYDVACTATRDAIKMWATCTLYGARYGARFGERPMPTSDVAVGKSPRPRNKHDSSVRPTALWSELRAVQREPERSSRCEKRKHYDEY